MGRGREPKAVDFCPQCLEIGRLNPFWPRFANKRHYVMVHEGLGYLWGTNIKKSKRVEARRRCYLVNPTHRRWAAGRLGFDNDDDEASGSQNNLIPYMLP